MSALDSNPSNKSFLSPIGFRFTMQRLPHVNYFCTQASIPDVTLGQPQIENVFIKLPQPGDKLSYSPINIVFRVSEDLANYREIYNWMEALGFPDNFAQRRSLAGAAYTNGDVFSDGSLIITTAAYKPNIEVKFTDMFPISLSTLDFTVENTDVEYLQATATFAYRKYDLITLE
jgi:ribosomal 50S subunit-recycling heat shock protein